MCGGLAVSCWYALVGMGSEWLYDYHLSNLKSENLAIILSFLFPKGHLSPSGHYWDLFWEADFAPGLRNTAVMLSLQK